MKASLIRVIVYDVKSADQKRHAQQRPLLGWNLTAQLSLKSSIVMDVGFALRNAPAKRSG